MLLIIFFILFCDSNECESPSIKYTFLYFDKASLRISRSKSSIDDPNASYGKSNDILLIEKRN